MTDATKLMELVEKRSSLAEQITALELEARAVQERIAATCHHPIMVRKSSYISGGYDYQGEDRTWNQCTICGHTSSLKVVMTGFS